jgi:hypothetical protein
MKMMETNLAAVAKAIDSTEERAEKLRKRGQKAKAQQVAEASSAVSNAYAEWDSQAPYVFEKLQVADESRCNNLRDSLTRMQTFELDHAQSAIQAAEATLALMLDVSTNDEVKAFTSKSTAGRQKIERQRSRTVIYPPHPSTPSIVTDDSVSVQSSGSGGGTLAGGMLLHRFCGKIILSALCRKSWPRPETTGYRSSESKSKQYVLQIYIT